jgi:uncharacterized repeat protein (TIGR01451 family)
MKRSCKIPLILVTALFLVAGAAYGQQPPDVVNDAEAPSPHAVSRDLPGVYALPQPPAESNPRTTSEEELAIWEQSHSKKSLITVQRRSEWFFKQRVYPFDSIPPGARLAALGQLDKMFPEEASVAATEDAAAAAVFSTRWTEIGPMPTSSFWDAISVGGSSGRATAVAVDPSNSSTVYLGTANGGIWKTTNGGLSWTALTDFQPSLSIGSVTLDPTNPNTVYAGTGEENFSGDSYGGAGILKSTDGGAHWSQITGPFVFNTNGGSHIGSLAVSPSDNRLILAAVESFGGTIPWGGAVMRSTDGGSTWTATLSGIATAVMFDPTSTSTAYATLGSPYGDTYNGVYKSTDSGQTWKRISGTGSHVIPTSGLGRIGLALAPSSPSTLYATIAQPIGSSQTDIVGVFKTTDGGANWIHTAAPPSCCTWYEGGIAIDPKNPNVIVTGGFDASISLDGGNTWRKVSAGSNGVNLHPDQHAFAFSADGAKLYVGNDGGAFSTSQFLSTSPFAWNDLNSTLATLQFYPGMSIDPSNAGVALGGTQDNGTEYYSGNVAWNETTCGDGGMSAIDPVSPSNVYTFCQGDFAFLQKSTTGGSSRSGWFAAQTGIVASDRASWVPPLAIDPSNHLTLYYGTYRVYQTTSGAGSWTPISEDLTGGGFLSAIAVAPSNGNTAYAASNDGRFHITTNAGSGVGSIWTDRSSGLPNRAITAIAVDFTNPQKVYVALSGFDSGHVFKSTNGGLSWTDISGNLPNIPADDLVVDPTLPNTLYLATDIGVFRTANLGAKWSTLVSGLPRTPVLSLRMHGPTRTLRAATHGRSVWDIHMPIADLALTMVEAPNPVRQGTNMKYTVHVTNNGPDTAAATTVIDTVPSFTTYQSVTTTVGTCSHPAIGGTGKLSCALSDLKKGSSVTIVLIVKDTANSGSTLSNTASVSSSTPDPKPKNNVGTLRTRVN